MPKRIDLSVLLILSGFSLTLAACGSQGNSGEASSKTANGWTSTVENGTFRMERQLKQLSVSLKLDPENKASATVRASAKPCLKGRGDEFAQASFATSGEDDVSRLASIRGRLDEVIGTVADRCDFPEDLSQRIMSGFDGMYFRTSGDRAKLKSS